MSRIGAVDVTEHYRGRRGMITGGLGFIGAAYLTPQ